MLASLALLDWHRHGGRPRAWLAGALACLALVAVEGRVAEQVAVPGWASALDLAVFIAGAYGVVRFRNALVPLPGRALLAVTALTVAVAALGALIAVAALPSAVMAAIVAIVIVAWALLVGEPVVRFWLVSRELPRVQRSRMRALSIGWGGLAVIVLGSVVAGAALQTFAGKLAVQLIALAMVPLIYVSFSPPAWLRLLWRYREEAELNTATRQLLVFSPTSTVLAERAVEWAARLVGARGALILGPEGELMARTGLADGQVEAITREARRVLAGAREHAVVLPSLIVVPLPLHDGPAALAVASGPYTPIFGTEEVSRLESYAGSITAGIERTRVTERLAAMEQAKSRFLNLASHELRGPITLLRGYISMLESGLLGSLNQEGQRAVAVITAKIIEMNALVEQMLEAARLEEGRLELERGPHDLRTILRSAAESLAPLVDERHRLVAEVGPRQVTVDVDERRIQTILVNLFDNAMKYSPDGGTVRGGITVRDGAALVEVSDEGVGIAPEHQAALFTRFGRILTPETAHIPGTGLGLYLCRELARLHGGDLTARSTPGKGSVFTLSLPLAGDVSPAPVSATSGALP